MELGSTLTKLYPKPTQNKSLIPKLDGIEVTMKIQGIQLIDVEDKVLERMTSKLKLLKLPFENFNPTIRMFTELRKSIEVNYTKERQTLTESEKRFN